MKVVLLLAVAAAAVDYDQLLDDALARAAANRRTALRTAGWPADYEPTNWCVSLSRERDPRSSSGGR